MQTSRALHESATRLIEQAREAGAVLYAAESCTGGLVTATLTEVAGSSDVVMQGFVTYSNAAKKKALGVPEETLTAYGAVSEQVARAMAEGALANGCPAPGKRRFAVSITGIAGPGGGSKEKPVGTVHLAVAGDGIATRHQSELFPGDRHTIRLAAVSIALDLLSFAIRKAA